MTGTKIIVRVVWGLLPDQPMGEWRRALTAEQVEDQDRYMAMMGEAIARYLRVADPALNNWATIEWVWL